MIPRRLRISVPAALFLVATTLGPARAAENPLAKGQWAFEFAADVFSANAASFIVRRHFSPRSALQLDAYVTSVGAEMDANLVDADPGDTLFEVENETSHFHSVQLGASYVFYPRKEGKALLFLSGGGFYSRGKNSDHDTFTDTGLSTPRQGTIESGARTWGAGVIGKLGFDWFFASHLSLGSRYGASLGYEHRDSDFGIRVDEGGQVARFLTHHSVEKSWRFDMTQLQIGISFYP